MLTEVALDKETFLHLPQVDRKGHLMSDHSSANSRTSQDSKQPSQSVKQTFKLGKSKLSDYVT